MWWSGVVGVAGTQRRTRANETSAGSVQQQQEFILQTKPAQNQHEDNGHTYTVSAGRRESKQTTQSNRSSKHQISNFVFPRPSPIIDFATITQPIKSNNISNESFDNYLLKHLN